MKPKADYATSRNAKSKPYAWVDRRKLFKIFLYWYVETNKSMKGVDYSESIIERCMAKMLMMLKPAIKNGLMRKNANNALHSLRYDMDDVLNEVYLKLSTRTIPSFNRKRTRAFNHNNFYFYVENGINYALSYLLGKEKKRRSKRESESFFGAMTQHVEDTVLYTTGNYDTLDYNYIEMVTDILAILRKNRSIFTEGEREVVDYILNTEDIHILGRHSYLSDKFHRTRQFRRNFVKKVKGLLQSRLSIVD